MEKSMGVFVQIIAHWTLARVIFYASGLLALFAASPITNHPVPFPSLGEIWQRIYQLATVVDTNWYMTIATTGYSTEPFDGKQTNWTFSPLFPVVLQFVGPVGGAVLANAAGVLGAWVMYLYLKNEIGEPSAKFAVLALVYFPFSFALGTARPEAILLLLWACSLLFFSSRNHANAAACAFLAALTKPNGLMIGAALAVMLAIRLREERRLPRASELFALLSPAGALFLFSVFAWSRTGDPLVWVKAPQAWGSKLIEQPLWQLFTLFSSPMLIDRWGWDITAINWIVFFSACFFVGVLVYRRKWALAAFLFFTSALSFVNLGVWVHGRHMSASIPYFAALALTVTDQRVRDLVLPLFASLLGVFSVFVALRVYAFMA